MDSMFDSTLLLTEVTLVLVLCNRLRENTVMTQRALITACHVHEALDGEVGILIESPDLTEDGQIVLAVGDGLRIDQDGETIAAVAVLTPWAREKLKAAPARRVISIVPDEVGGKVITLNANVALEGVGT